VPQTQVDESLLHKVELSWITPYAESVVAKHARVSTKDPDRDEYTRLLEYCIKHGHWSVFEQVCASFEIITTRAISPQILRHRSFTFQETSQRYCDPLDVLEQIVPDCSAFELRSQDLKNRQNSFQFGDDSTEKLFRKRIEELFESSQELYDDMLSANVAKECARNVLLMCSPTRLHMTGTLRSWIFYVGLRGNIGTQQEHRQIALGIGDYLADLLPVISTAVMESAHAGANGLEGWQFI
jgi:thymidylate synthase (FAD)